MKYATQDVVTSQFQRRFISTAVELRALLSIYIPHFYVDEITYPCSILNTGLVNSCG